MLCELQRPCGLVDIHGGYSGYGGYGGYMVDIWWIYMVDMVDIYGGYTEIVIRLAEAASSPQHPQIVLSYPGAWFHTGGCILFVTIRERR